MRRRLQIAGLLLVALAGGVSPVLAFPTEVRVRLFDRTAPQALTVSATRGLFFFDGDSRGSALAEVPPYERATIRRRGEGIQVSFGETTFLVRSLHVMPSDDGLFNVAITEGAQPQKARRYPGWLKLTIVDTEAPALMLVNHVRLDEYVACVVSREYSFNDLEGTKAMAVLARTYVLRNASSANASYDLVDHQLAQQYDGADRLTDASIEATIQTLGEVLTYNDTLVEAVYYSSSGGHTADNDAVWDGNPVPYLRGVPDPYDSVSPHSSWRTTVPRAALLSALREHASTTVVDFRIADRSRDGRVQTLELIQKNRMTQTISGNTFRLLVNKKFGIMSLKSTLFDIQPGGNKIVFEGRGFGHGVGMSQYGALGMSKQGYSYRDILSFYFTGTQVQRWNSR